MPKTEISGAVRLSATNVGGIDETTVEFRPGVTILEGRNATNRTSLLQACMTVLGSERVSLKGDADAGSVELEIGDETYTRRLERRNGTVTTTGDPYLEDAELADLFAFLLESNRARQAVARGDDLRKLIMQPVDTEAIQTEIRQLEDEKRRLDDELGELEELKGELPGLERERNRIESDIDAKREELERKEAELETADADLEETREEKAELEEKLDELRETRARLEDVRFDIETETESLSALRDERGDLEVERDELAEAPLNEVEEISARIDRMRAQKRRFDAEINELQSTIEFNEEMLDASEESAVEVWPDDSASTDAVTDKLLAGDGAVTCWTCGSAVERSQIETTLDQLRNLRQEKLDESRSLRDELDELTDRKGELERQQRRYEEIGRRLDRIDDEIEDRTQKVADLRDRRDGLTEEVSDLEAEIESLEEQEYSEILDLHKEANQLEFELGKLETELESVTDEITAIEERLAEQSQIEEQRAAVQAELADLRTRIDQIERRAVEAFNDHMDEVLEILEYANIERIWIERTERSVREGRKKVSKSVFDLHIVRRTQSGTTYEDTVDHLSESEREVTGLIFALAGYLVHDVHETLPFILLDSLEAIDSNRIAELVDYLKQYADHLIVALLPEDASALDDSYQRITEI